MPFSVGLVALSVAVLALVREKIRDASMGE